MSDKSHRFTLHHAGPSPFARKVRAVTAELGLESDMTYQTIMVAPGKENADYARDVNPLKRVPAMTLDDGTTLIDSSLICQYLDETAGNKLVPPSGPQRWAALNAATLANGLMEVAVQLRYETFARPEEHRWSTYADDLRERIVNTLDALENRSAVIASNEASLAGINLVCALDYLDFRHPDIDWRSRCPQLTGIHAELAERPSLQSTRPEA